VTLIYITGEACGHIVWYVETTEVPVYRRVQRGDIYWHEGHCETGEGI